MILLCFFCVWCLPCVRRTRVYFLFCAVHNLKKKKKCVIVSLHFLFVQIIELKWDFQISRKLENVVFRQCNYYRQHFRSRKSKLLWANLNENNTHDEIQANAQAMNWNIWRKKTHGKKKSIKSGLLLNIEMHLSFETKYGVLNV